MKRLFIALFITALALVAITNIALAHAKIDHCDPAVGSTNATAPTQVRCWFTEELDTKQSTLSVTDSKGQRVDNNDAQVDLNDKEHKQMFVTVKSLPQGVYQVAWKAFTSDDNTTTQGEWFFGVGQVTLPPSSATPASPSTVNGPDATRTYVVAGLLLAAAGAIAWIARQVIK